MKTPITPRWTAALLVGAVLLLSAPLMAQGKWWQAGHQFKKELELTQEQSRRLEDVFQAALPALRALKKGLDKAETELEALVERGGDQAVMEHLNHVEIARADLNKARYMMLLRMRKVLTTSQWARFTALHQAAEKERLQREHAAGGGVSGGGSVTGGSVTGGSVTGGTSSKGK
jgi:Spy/CpxP family protein refolding chaperone